MWFTEPFLFCFVSILTEVHLFLFMSCILLSKVWIFLCLFLALNVNTWDIICIFLPYTWAIQCGNHYGSSLQYMATYTVLSQATYSSLQLWTCFVLKLWIFSKVLGMAELISSLLNLVLNICILGIIKLKYIPLFSTTFDISDIWIYCTFLWDYMSI